MSIKTKTHIHWFGNDLRLSDQPFAEKANRSNELIGLYIIDPNRVCYNQWGFRSMSLHRLQVLREHLRNLQCRLNQNGVPLLIKYGDSSKIVPELVIKHDASLSFMNEYATEERITQKHVLSKLKNTDVFTYDGNFLFHPQNTDWKDSFPQSFSKFRKCAEKHLKNTPYSFFPELKQFNSEVIGVVLKPSQRNLDHSTALPFRGGESAGKKRLNAYLFETRNASQYKETRNGLLGKDYSTKFSFWLSTGALSPNMIMKELKKYEAEFEQNNSTYWIFFELLWRDFFRHAGKYYEDKYFAKNGLRDSGVRIDTSDLAFKEWTKAKTRNDFINANMTELVKTGFMSNRGRQNVASYFVHELKQDWRKGAAWFEHCLVDYDVYSNHGNWGYISGVYFNPKGGSEFNIEFQANHYDQSGTYRKTWLKN